MKLGLAIKMGQSKTINIDDSKEYVIAGVQSYGKGVINRRTELGKNLKMKKYQVIEKNYLMWCKVDTKNGAFGITMKEHVGSLASTNMALAKIDTDKFNPHFLERLFTFNFFHGYITHLSSGSTNRKYLTPKQLSELVELPNLSKDEQDNFISLVNIIENLGISNELTHQLDLVKQLRQAFLREAMQGKLTAKWRESRKLSGLNVEPASELLKKIKAEKEKLVKEGKLKKDKPLPAIKESEIPFEIPENWEWCRLGEITYNISTGPFGTMLHKSDYTKSGIPLVNPMNIIEEKIIPSDKMLVNEETKKRLKSYILNEGDIVIGRRGEMGRCAIVTNIESGWICGTGSFFLQLSTSIFKKYFIKYTRSESAKSILLGESVGSTMDNLNHRILNNLPFPLPPISEQQQIVTKLDELMQYCDDLEKSIKTSQQQNEMLLQQVLREALEP